MPLTAGEKLIRSLLPPEVRKVRAKRAKQAKAEAALKEQRKRPRVNIHDLNKEGVQALQKAGITTDKLQDPDTRGGFEKVLDWVDLPRNTIAQIVGRLAGVKFDDIKQRGALGMKRVYMSDVLKRAGVKNKAVRAIGGFLGDVAIDPLTYLTAGATTGKAIGRHLPKVTKSFYKTLGQIARGITEGLDPNLVKALGGPTRVKRLAMLAKSGKKGVQKRLLGKRGGFLSRALARAAGQATPQGEVARKLLTKPGVSLKGRKLFRLPFTQIAGPTLPGKQARLFKSLSDTKGYALQKELRTLIGKIHELDRLRNALQKARQAEDTPKVVALARQVREATEAITKGPGGKKKVKEILARAKNRLRISTGVPEMAPGVQREKLWATLGRGAKTRIGRSARKVFGPPQSPLRQRELGLLNRMTFGADAKSHGMAQRLQPIVDDAARVVMENGLAANMDDARRLLGKAFEVGDMERLKLLHPSSPMHAEADILNKVFSLPEYQKFATEGRRINIEYLTQLKAKGANIADVKELAPDTFLPHIVAPEVQPHLAKQLYGRNYQQMLNAQQGRAVHRGMFSSPFAMKRDKLIELALPTGERKTFLTRSTAEIKGFRKAHPDWRQAFELVDKQGNVHQTFEFGAKELAENMAVLKQSAPGMSLRPKQWEMTAEWFNRNLADKEFGGTLIGSDAMTLPLERFFETDPTKAFAALAAKHERAMAVLDLKQLARQHGVTMDIPMLRTPQAAGLAIPKGIDINHPIREFLGSGIYPTAGATGPKAVAFPIPVTDMLNRFKRVFEGGEELNAFLRASDMTLSWFKRWALFHPAYPLRNVFDNLFGVVMAGGSPVKTAKLAFFNKKVKALGTAVDTGDLSKIKGMTIDLAGKKFSMEALAQEAIRNNYQGAGFTAAQTVPTYLRGTGVGSVVGRKVDAAGKQAIDFIRNINTTLEGRMRLATWLGFLDDGMAPRQAAMQTLLAMPDLSNVTQMEKQFATRIFPWYRWAKNNGARVMFHILPQKPAFIAGVGKLQNLVEAFDERVPNNLRPEWMRKAQAAQFTGDEKEGSAWLLRSWFPFEEVQSLAAGLAEPSETARWLYGSARPGIKFGAELATGHDIFRNRPVQPFTLSEAVGLAPKAVLGASGTPLDNLLAMRPIREYGRRVWEQPGVMGKASRAVLGGAVQPLSEAGGLKEMDLKTAGDIAKLRRKIVRAKENKDAVELQSLLVQLMQLQAQRQRYDLTIPKDTQRVLAGAGMSQ